MATPSAVAKALIQANRAASQANNGSFGGPPATLPGNGMSPLVASYGEWSAGRAYGGHGALPRDWATFLSGSFGPLAPIQPVPVDSPPDGSGLAAPRRWQYPIGWDMPLGPPGTEGLKLADFTQLRTIADTYSVARACIDLRKQELLGLDWDIVPTKDAEKAMQGDTTARRDFADRRAKLVKFFRRPDTDYFDFTSWWNSLLEDVLAVDAMTLYLHPPRRAGKGAVGSNLAALEVLDGTTIRPLVNIRGGRPQPPNPAYQQYLWGVPRVDLMTLLTGDDIAEMGQAQVAEYTGAQLLYLPAETRAWTPYGMAPTEKAIMPILAGLQRQQWQLDAYNERSIPGLFVSSGDPSSTPTQLRELQDALNAMAGDPAWGHKIIVLPAGSRIDPQRPAELAGAFDEIIMTQVCMGYGVMPMELGISPKVSATQSSGAAHQMAKTSRDTHDRKANGPMLTRFMRIFDFIIQTTLGQPDARFLFDGLEEGEDEQTLTEIQSKRVSIGLMSIDEARIANGEQPWGLPLTSEPVLVTPTGVIPIGSIDPKTGQPAGLTPKLTAAPPPPGAGPTGPDDGDKPGGTRPPEAPKPTPAGGAARAPATPAHSASRQHADTTNAPAQAGAVAKAAAAPPVAVHAALRELDLIRRRLVKGRSLDGWVPEHLPANVFADVAATGDVDRARAVLKAIGRRQDRERATAAAAAGIVAGLHRLAGQLADGLSPAAFIDHATTVLRDGIRAALAAGTADATGDRVVKAVPAEFEQWRQAFNARFAQYAAQAQVAYEQGYGLRTLAGPGSWEIEWRATSADPCDLCSGRDGNRYAPGDVPGWPGMGGFGANATICRGGPHCRCELVYHRNDSTPVPDAAPTGPSGDFGRQLASLAGRAREALGDDPAYEELLDTVADDMAAAQQPYLAGLVQDIITGLTEAVSPPPRQVPHTRAPDGGHGWLVPAALTTAVIAAAVAGQEQSQQPPVQPADEPAATKGKHGTADTVYRYLARHYPPDVLEWVKTAHWRGPQTVALSDVDMARRPGGRNPTKVQQIAHAIDDGLKLDPIVLVRTPAGEPYQIADGYHRTLALVHAGRRTVQAWVGDVDTDTGPWDRAMHESKLNKADEGLVGDEHARHLHEYWTRGEGLARWIDSPHPWTALYHGLLEYIHDPDEAKRTASRWFHDATGMWSGERRGKDPAGPG